jgi:hypothetical protein
MLQQKSNVKAIPRNHIILKQNDKILPSGYYRPDYLQGLTLTLQTTRIQALDIQYFSS